VQEIKIMRERANMTQCELAQKIGVEQSAISMWETGEARPRTNKLPVLAKILNCTIDDLFTDKERGVPPEIMKGKGRLRKKGEEQ